MNDARELYDILDRLKRQIQDNVSPDGSCRFNAADIKTMLELTEMTLQKSVEAYTTE